MPVSVSKVSIVAALALALLAIVIAVAEPFDDDSDSYAVKEYDEADDNQVGFSQNDKFVISYSEVKSAVCPIAREFCCNKKVLTRRQALARANFFADIFTCIKEVVSGILGGNFTVPSACCNLPIINFLCGGGKRR